ncbi:MAG: M24 family metallopeptidase [Planctomycetota bacterium]
MATTTQRAETTTARVDDLRAKLRAEGLSAVIVRSTDRYLNEYVPADESERVWLTGFTGSAGDALVGLDAAWLCVDGRYRLQSEAEVEGTPFSVEHVALGTSIRAHLFDLLKRQVAKQGAKIAYAPHTFTVREREELERVLQGSGATLVATSPSLINQIREPVSPPIEPVRGVPVEVAGLSVGEKLTRCAEVLAKHDLAAYVVQPLDALAYMTNLRGSDFVNQATFRGVGLLFRERMIVSAPKPTRIPTSARAPELDVVDQGAWRSLLPARGRVGYDPDETTADVIDSIRGAGAEPVAVPSPVTPLKAKKTDAELAAMKRAFALADKVMEDAIAFVARKVDAGESLTEQDLADEVLRLHLSYGATGLSFRVIAAVGANAANIHYSHPDPSRQIGKGELVLIDTGGYYEGGYATDLTRTFLAGSAASVAEGTPEQKRNYTLVLKCAIAGMAARLPVAAYGEQLDALVRAPLWAEGLDYRHGTGHGVGINVHEAPPRVSTRNGTLLEPNQVFSIEPGLYLPNWGGIRIENLCTVAPSPDAEGFHDVVPLTFAALDDRLIDDALLTPQERAWLARYAEQRREVLGVE